MATATHVPSRITTLQRLLSLRFDTFLPWLLLFALTIAVLYPLSMIVYSSFRTTPPGSVGDLTITPWIEVLNVDTLYLLLMTFRVVLPKVILAITIATFFAWIIVRTDTSCKSLLASLLAFMFFVPNLPWTLSWILLISPRSGFLNQLIGSIIPEGFRFNAFSYEALVILGAMHSVPILFLLIYPAFQNMDPALEEASYVSGANRWITLRYITLPLLAPAILAAAALSTVISMESFETEQLLGVPAGIFVLTTKIYYFLYGESSMFGHASALSMILLIFTLSLVFIQRRILSQKSYTTVTGKGYRPQTIPLGRWRWVTLAIVAGYLLIFGILPFAILILNSLMEVSGFVNLQLLTIKNWSKAFTASQLVTSIQNTLIVGFGTATLGVIIVSIISYTITRLKWTGRALMDFIAWLPIAVPGIVLALGFLWAFVSLPIYGTVWILILAYLIRGLPTSSRFFTSTMVQIGTELEEASRVHGATWFQTLIRIWLPLLLTPTISAWIYLFVIAVRILDSALLLTGPHSEVLSVSIFQQSSRGDYGVASALALIQIGIIIAAYFFIHTLGRISKGEIVTHSAQQ